MKLDSKIFDRIRIHREPEQEVREDLPACDWAGCDQPASHPAPKGRDREGEYFRFCVDHVRLYNKSYNYFSGMNDADVADFLKDATTGHRPTSPIGVNARGRSRAEKPEAAGNAGAQHAGPHDGPQGAFAFFTRRRFRSGAGFQAEEVKPRRKLKRLEARALGILDLDDAATGDDIKARFKALVKRHHPDANGGDRSSEARLQEIIEAYNLLRTAGLC